jgi:hypothetical protein
METAAPACSDRVSRASKAVFMISLAILQVGDRAWSPELAAIAFPKLRSERMTLAQKDAVG